MNKQDFESKYSGLEIDEAVGRGLGLSPEANGWIKLPSTAEKPVDINTIFNLGNYTTTYATGTIPEGIAGTSPLNFTVVNAPWGTQPNLVQYITYADLTYYRYRVGTSWNSVWTRALASNYIYSNDSATPPANPENGTIWIHPSADGATMDMKVYYSSRGWRSLHAEGLMSATIYDPTGQRQDLFALIDNKFTALQIDVNAIKAHMADKVIHITAEERASWNDKPTNAEFTTAKTQLTNEINTQISTQTGGYETRLTEFNTRITTMTNTLNTHAANAIIHVTASDKTNWNGKAEANHTHLNDNRVTIDAADVTSGVFDLARIPKEAFNDVVEVNTVADMYKLTKTQVQNGDTVHVKTPPSFYFVVDDTKLNVAAGYMIYSVGVLDEILWANIRNKPTTVAGYGLTDAYTKAQVDAAIAVTVADIGKEVQNHSSMINYVVANDVLQDVQDVYYPQENLNILQGNRRENQLYPYAESEIWTSSGTKLGYGFNEWSVLPKYATDDISSNGIYANQPYRIPKIPADYNPSTFKTKFPEEFVDETMVSMKYYHMDTAGKIQAGAPPQVPPGGSGDNLVVRRLTDWNQIFCGANPAAAVACKKIKSYQVMTSAAPFNYTSHVCIIGKRGDVYTGNNSGHLAIAYENAERNTIEVFENPFLAATSSTTTDPVLRLKRRNWQGFMMNPNAPALTIGGLTSNINDTTMGFPATSTNPTTDIDLLLSSAGGFNIYDFDLDMVGHTLVVAGSVRISLNNGTGAANPRLTAGTKQGETVVPARAYPAVLICDILFSDTHPGAATVNTAITLPANKDALGKYIVGFLPVSLQVCAVSGVTTNTYANRFGLNFFENDEFISYAFNSVTKSICVKRIDPSTTASPPMVTGDRRSAFMIYADQHFPGGGYPKCPYPIGLIFSAWNATSLDIAATSRTLRRSVLATAELPARWSHSATEVFPVTQLLPNFHMLTFEGLTKSNARYVSSILFGSVADVTDTYNGKVCPWYIVDPYTYYGAQNTTAENSRLANVKYRTTKLFAFDAPSGNKKKAFRIADLQSDGTTFVNSRDTYHFFRTDSSISTDNKYPTYVLVNGQQNRWASVRISYEPGAAPVSSAVVYQESLNPVPADTILPSMYPAPMKLTNKTGEPPTPWNHFYQLPISDIGIIPYTIRQYDQLLRDDYGSKLREMTEAIDRQRIRTGVIWAKRGNLVEMTGMTTIISHMPMGAPYTDTAFLGTINSEYYVGYITEFGEVHKRKLIYAVAMTPLKDFHPRAIFSGAIWYDAYDYGSTAHTTPMPEQVGLLGYNSSAAAKCLMRVNITNFYSFVDSSNYELTTTNVIKDTAVVIPDNLANNKESFIKVIGSGLAVTTGATPGFTNKLADSNTTAWQGGCQMAMLYDKPANHDYGPVSDSRQDSLIVADTTTACRYIKTINASIFNPTNISGKKVLYRELIHSSDGVPVFFMICGKAWDDAAQEAVLLIPKSNTNAPEILRVPWPIDSLPWVAGYFRSSHRWMYCGGKAYPCEGHPSFLMSNKFFVVQILARIPSDASIPRVSILDTIPVKLHGWTGSYSYGAIGAGNPGAQKNPTTDMDLAPIAILCTPGNDKPDSIYAYQPPVTETDLSDDINSASNDKNYAPVYATEKLMLSTVGAVYQPPGASVRMYSCPGFQLAKTRDLGIVGADGSWYVTMTASRALSEQINFARLIQDAYTWKNQAQYQNIQIQSMWKTVHDAQPMLQSILNLI